jgi:hypothetical protein
LALQFNTIFAVLAQDIVNEKKKSIKIENKDVKLYLSTDDMTQKILKILWKKLEIINEYSKVVGHKINILKPIELYSKLMN